MYFNEWTKTLSFFEGFSVWAMNKYCIVTVCPNGSKKRPDLNYCCFPVWSPVIVGEQTKIKWTNRSKNLFETDTVISISGRKNIPLGCYPTIFDHTKAKNTTSARSKRLDHQRWRCAEQPKATKGKALRLLRTVLGKRIQDKNLAFRAKLIDRGYPETLIMTTLSKIKFEDRKLALQQKCKEDKRILSFVAQYRPTVPNLKQILMQK